MAIETRLFINGEFVESSDKKTFDLKSPANLKFLATVHEATKQDVDSAVAAAKAAFPSWSALSPRVRGSYFKKFAALIREHKDELAELEGLSMGKPKGSFMDAEECSRNFDYYAEAGYEVKGTATINSPGYVGMTLRQPYGVAAAIIPWNAPLIFFAKKIAPALIVGNTAVLKSSEKAPLTSIKLAELAQKAGFPPGVLNVITGFGYVSGNALSHHMDVRVISFTGSSRTGRAITAAAAKSNMKNVLLELGGKSPCIIFEDADLDNAVAAAVFSIQANSGQICMASSRVYVQDTIADKFITLYKNKFSNVKMGNPEEPGVNHGPQADEVQYNTVLKYIESGKKSGGELILGEDKPKENGYFISPTIFKNTPEDAQIMKEEIFGPVVSINVFSSEEDVLAKANDTEFGLYGSVFTKDLDRALRFAKGMEAGTIGINCSSPTIGVDLPFGGYKSSGIGREGYGAQGSMNEFLETKTIMIKLS